MKIRILHFGKVKNKDFEALVDYYKKLSEKYFEIELIQLKDLPEEKISSLQLAHYLDQDLVLLDELGKEYLSKEFANFVFNKKVNDEDLTFVIGNAFGFDDELKQKFKRISLSKFTVPHELAFVILVEQIYRAGSILNNSKYHK